MRKPSFVSKNCIFSIPTPHKLRYSYRIELYKFLFGIFDYSILYYFEQSNTVQELCSKSLHYSHIYTHNSDLSRKTLINRQKFCFAMLDLHNRMGLEIVHIDEGNLIYCVYPWGVQNRLGVISVTPSLFFVVFFCDQMLINRNIFIYPIDSLS